MSAEPRALICQEFGQAEAIQVLPWPVRRPLAGEVRVKVTCAMLTFADGLKTRGAYQIKSPPPFVPGACGCGEVVELGEGVPSRWLGRMVTFLNVVGACAEEIITSRESLAAVPPGIRPSDATALRLYYPAVHFALVEQGRLQPGDTLLVTGAGGANSIAAIHLGRIVGARVIACASRADRLEAAKAAGADHLVNYSDRPFSRDVLDLTDGRGVDVVFEVVGGNVFHEAIRCTADFGRVVIFGFASGEIPEMKTNRVLLRNIALVGANYQRYASADPTARLLPVWEKLVGWMAEGELPKRELDVRRLNEAPGVIRALWDGPLDRPALIEMGGKAVKYIQEE